jgi:DNA-binding CsgD family transcriptional regulator
MRLADREVATSGVRCNANQSVQVLNAYSTVTPSNVCALQTAGARRIASRPQETKLTSHQGHRRKVSDANDYDFLGAKARTNATLTRRQRDVLALLLRGCTDKQMCARLGMAHGTLRTHIARLYNEFGVNNRAALVGRWHRQVRARR